MQYVPQVFVAEAQPFLNPMPTMPDVDPYEEMEKEAKTSDIPLPQPILFLIQSFSKAFASQGLEEAVEDNLT
ncbi:hypothetical protein H5410_027550 [Solanum commersonii]|uniref:Uncharacterized protein n=1 Tax=Solanum commersonii TaxID=4109 RepID=A0A9J5Z061_SOLCO|nr:hypothetical protein H5410_027550 [Solanum commersonii]